MVVIKACLSLLLGVIFLLSAIPKLRRPKGFVLTVLEYRVLPPLLGRIYGWSLPLLELFLALLLLSGTYVRLTALVLSLLLLSFILAVSVNIVRGRDLNCGCFGTKQRKIGWKLLLEDLALLGSALILVTLSSDWIGLEESWSIYRLISSHLASPLALLLSGGIAIGAVLLLRRKSALQGKKHVSTSLEGYNAERVTETRR